MQTILGSGGAIGIELAKALKQYTNKIRLVSRNPEKVNDTDELLAADLLIKEEVDKAVEGSEIVYVTVGFPYKLKVWQKSWPTFIHHVIEACIKHNCKLVFFDNIYMYDVNCIGDMTENCKINPPSKKGLVRTQVAEAIMSKVKEGKLTALIARSADFYGPGIKDTSMLTETVFKNLVKGKKANWMGPLNFKHSFTYTPDAGKATAILGNSEDAFGQVWHLPTASDPLTGKEWIDTIAEKLNVKAGYQPVSRGMAKFLGLFIPVMRELPEMMYQYDRDYVFQSDKFETHFTFEPTSYQKGIENIVKSDFS